MKIRWCWVTWSKILSIFHFIVAFHHLTYSLSFSISWWSCFQSRIIWAFCLIKRFEFEAFRFIKSFKFWSISSSRVIQFWSISSLLSGSVLKHFVSSLSDSNFEAIRLIKRFRILKHFVSSSSDSSNDSNSKHFASSSNSSIWSISRHISLRSRFETDH